MFGSYEVAKSRTLQQLDPDIFRNSPTAHLSSGAGFAAICVGGTVGGTAYTSLSSIFSQIGSISRAMSGIAYCTRHAGCRSDDIAVAQMLRTLLPSPLAFVATLPAQVFGFVAFEYGKAFLEGPSASRS